MLHQLWLTITDTLKLLEPSEPSLLHFLLISSFMEDVKPELKCKSVKLTDD